MTRRAALAVLPVVLAFAGACATTPVSPFDRYYDEGRYAELVRTFEADTTLWEDERAVFRTALVHALPGSPVYDLDRARLYLGRFLDAFEESERRAEVRRLVAVLDEIARVRATAARHEADAAALRSRVGALEDSLVVESARHADAIEQLRSELARQEARLRALQQELDRLKDIDLRVSPPPRPLN